MGQSNGEHNQFAETSTQIPKIIQNLLYFVITVPYNRREGLFENTRPRLWDDF